MIRKRRKNILWHILLPIVLILVLIPPACSLVFWHFADQFAHYAAASELGKIQEPLTALIGKHFLRSLRKSVRRIAESRFVAFCFGRRRL